MVKGLSIFLCMLNILVTLEKLRAFINHRTALGSTTGSFYAISQQRFNRQINLWKEHLPAVFPYYAVKCNPDPYLMTWMSQQNIGFDCASARELSIAKRIDPRAKILYANPCKKKDDIHYAISCNVNSTVIDSHEEIDKLQELEWKGSSLLRLRVEDGGSLMPFSAKFGAEFYNVKALADYAKLKGQDLHGISFHVGSGCGDPQQYKKAIEMSNEAINILKTFGHNANVIDIGGGFMSAGFPDTAKVIRSSRANIGKNIRMVAEPGRFFAATTHDLFVQVIGKKYAANGKKGWRYTIDESLYGQFSCIPYDHAKPRWIRIRKEGEKIRPKTAAVLYGRTCDSVDFIASADEAEELEEGDWLWFPNMGAYTTVTSTEFNGFPKPPSLVIEDHQNEQLPDLREFDKSECPSNLKYVSAVKVPSF